MQEDASFKLLIKEYELMTGQYQHEDKLLENRNSIYTVVNLGMLGAMKILAPSRAFLLEGQLSQSQAKLDLCTLAISFLGFIICLVWYFVSRAGRYYIYLRLEQAASIEMQLGTLQMYTLEKAVFYHHKQQESRGRIFKPMPRSSMLAHQAATYVSLCFGAVWLVIFLLLLIGAI